MREPNSDTIFSKMTIKDEDENENENENENADEDNDSSGNKGRGKRKRSRRHKNDEQVKTKTNLKLGNMNIPNSTTKQTDRFSSCSGIGTETQYRSKMMIPRGEKDASSIVHINFSPFLCLPS